MRPRHSVAIVNGLTLHFKLIFMKTISTLLFTLISLSLFAQQSATCLTQLERSWLNGLNEYRQKKGVEPLIYSEQLTLAACAQIENINKSGSELEFVNVAPNYKGFAFPIYFVEAPNYVGITSYLQAWEGDDLIYEVIANNSNTKYNAFGVCILNDVHYMYFGTEKDDAIEYVHCKEKNEKKYEWVIDPKLQYVKYFETEGAIAFRENNKWGFIDTTGNVIIPAEYFGVLWFVNGISCAQTMDEKAVMINHENEIVLKTDFYSLAPTQYLNRFIAGYSLTGPFVLTDENGKVITVKYDDIDITDGDYFTAITAGKAITIDNNGKTILNKNYKELNGPVEGYYSFSLNGKYGFMNEKFEETIKPEYTALIYYGFANGLSHFGYADNKVGFINYKNEKVIPNIYDEAGLFNEFGHTFCSLKGKYGVLNKDGSYIIEPQYDEIKRGCKEGNWITKQDGKFGILNNANEWKLEPTFDQMHYLSGNLYLVTHQGAWGLVRVE